MNKKEQMRFNGMDPTKFNLDVSDAELGKQIGNSMAQNVVERILHSLLPAAGLTNPLGPDRWKTGRAVDQLIRSRNKGFMNFRNCKFCAFSVESSYSPIAVQTLMIAHIAKEHP